MAIPQLENYQQALMSSQPILPDHPWYLNFDDAKIGLVDSVNVIAAYSCTDAEHDPRQLCSCPAAMATLQGRDRELYAYIAFVVEWEQHIMASDAALRFMNASDHAIFSQHANGLSPREFAERFARETFASPTMFAPAASFGETVDAMIAYWTQKTTDWLTSFETREGIRESLQAWQPGMPGAKLYNDLSQVDHRYPPQPGKRIVLPRVRAGPGWSPEHGKSTLFALPMMLGVKRGWPRYRILGVRPCHVDCERFELWLTKEMVQEILHRVFL